MLCCDCVWYEAASSSSADQRATLTKEEKQRKEEEEEEKKKKYVDYCVLFTLVCVFVFDIMDFKVVKPVSNSKTDLC